MNHEWIDETIDRVAGEMTMSRATVTFSLDVREAAYTRARFGRGVLVLTAVAASLVIAGTLSIWQSARTADVSGTVPLLSSRTLAPVSPMPLAARHRIVVAAKEATSAVSLAVEPLSVEALSIDAMSDVAPLSVKDIAIADIPGGDTKEYR